MLNDFFHARGVSARRVLREPLVQFLALGGALFLAAHFVADHHDNRAREITVDQPVIERLANLYEQQTGTKPSPERLTAIVDDYVRDEVLYREAIKLGLDQNDEIVRRRLTQKLAFLQRDLAFVGEPSEAQLAAFYQANLAKFTAPPSVTFTHAFFSPDHAGADAARQRAALALAQLKTAGEVKKLGDTFPLQSDYGDLAREDAVQLFGETPIVDTLFKAAPGEWVGPIQSGYGWHLVKTLRKKEAVATAFEQARPRVRELYLSSAREKANAESFALLKANYIVVSQNGKLES